MMRRSVLLFLGLGCFLVLLLVCYRPVLFEDGQFAYRDAAHFFYPLHLRVQQEWAAGRWPLWDSGQNGGAPLLGNPMAAVLYPGKVLFCLLPYAWAARLYVIAHTIIAFLGLVAMGRSCGLSWVGSCLGGLSYAFGAPVLFLYCNVIFLVGAAWIPWGLRAIHRLLWQGRRQGGVELALVLALQALGGDPEAAYLTALGGAGYAVLLAVRGRSRLSWLATKPTMLAVVCIWVAATLGMARSRIAWPGFLAVNGLVLAAWMVVAVAMAWRWYRLPGEARLAPLLARLAAACTLAMALAAAQLAPVLEFTGLSSRAAGDTANDVYYFSLDPSRVVELVWPNVFGTTSPVNRSWLQAVPPTGDHELWVVSLYIGGLALALALVAAGFRCVPPWRVWLTTLALVALLGSLGKYGGPLWWARWGPFTSTFGQHNRLFQLRVDDLLPDESGSLYGVLALLVPGFGAFRYPSKLLPFSAAAMAVLAAAGWDRTTEGDAATRRLRRLGLVGLGASLVGLAFALAARGRAITYLTGRVPPDMVYGPADIAGAWAETQRALAHGAIVCAAVVALAHWAPRHRRGASASALLILAADLAAISHRITKHRMPFGT